MKKLFPLLVAALLTISLSGCSVYRIDIQQGNEITAEMLAELKIGMPKEEVVRILGFPLVNDPFNANRWDYYFYLKKGGNAEVEQKSAALYFSGDTLRKIESALLKAK